MTAKPTMTTADSSLGLHAEEQAFELPARLFEQLPFAVYVCDRDGLVLRYNRRASMASSPVGTVGQSGFLAIWLRKSSASRL